MYVSEGTAGVLHGRLVSSLARGVPRPGFALPLGCEAPVRCAARLRESAPELTPQGQLRVTKRRTAEANGIKPLLRSDRTACAVDGMNVGILGILAVSYLSGTPRTTRHARASRCDPMR